MTRKIYLSLASLQNRRNFLRISGEQKRKRGESEARVACEGRSNPPLARNLRFALASLSPRFRLANASVPLKYAKNYACSAGYSLATEKQKENQSKSSAVQRVDFPRLASVARFLLPVDWSVYCAFCVCRDWPDFITAGSQESLLSLKL